MRNNLVIISLSVALLLFLITNVHIAEAAVACCLSYDDCCIDWCTPDDGNPCTFDGYLSTPYAWCPGGPGSGCWGTCSSPAYCNVKSDCTHTDLCGSGTCSVGSSNYCTYCPHCGDGSVNCGEACDPPNNPPGVINKQTRPCPYTSCDSVACAGGGTRYCTGGSQDRVCNNVCAWSGWFGCYGQSCVCTPGQCGVPLLKGNGEACTSDAECSSKHCAQDYDGTGAWCEPSTSCGHNGIEHPDGENAPDCQSTGSGTTSGARYKCSSGSWVTETCGYSPYNGCGGTGSPYSCQKKRDVYYCQAGTPASCYDGADDWANVASGKVCENGNEVDADCTKRCGYSGYNGRSADKCDKKKDCLACSGANACTYDVGDVYDSVSAYKIANSAGAEVDASSSDNAGTCHSCTDGSCSGTYKWGECNGTGDVGPCTTYYQAEAVYADTGYTLTSSCNKTGTTLCGYSAWNKCGGTGSPNTCQRGRDQLRCDAAHTCSYDVGDDWANVASGYVCSGGSEVAISSTYYCSYSDSNLNNCQWRRAYSSCNGANVCSGPTVASDTTCEASQATKGATSCTAVTTSNYCQALTDACNGPCQKRTNYYGCAGSGSTCEGTPRATSDAYLSTAGKVCSGGSEVAPSAGVYCDYAHGCTAGACTADKYWRGCAAGSSSCTSTGWVDSGTNYNAPADQTISVTETRVNNVCQVSSTTKCDDTDHCTGDALYDGYRCKGDGTCGNDYNDIGCCKGSKCAAGLYCEELTHQCTPLPECKARNDNGFGYTNVADGTSCSGTPGKCCGGVCDNDGTTSGSGLSGDCVSGPHCVATGDWGYSTANEGEWCGAARESCFDASSCDVRTYKSKCLSGSCTGNYEYSTACTLCTACDGQDCGGWVYYCYSASGCDTHRHKRYCSGESCTGEWGTDEDFGTGACNGQVCSDADHCSGNTYYTGKNCSAAEGSCSVSYGDIGCCQCSKCLSGYYCRESDHSCQDIPLCKKCDPGFGYTNQANNEDLWNDCAGPSFTGCDGGCKRYGPDGYCDGVGVCDTNDYTENCGVNAACMGSGICSPTAYCDATWNCSSGWGDNGYNAGGPYYCQGRCDGYNNCDYAVNCKYGDDDQTACTVCGGWYWNIGGEVSGTTCCGDDSSEYRITRICASGVCTTDPEDDACCNAANKCVYGGICYGSGVLQDIDSDGCNEYCDAGTWKKVPNGRASGSENGACCQSGIAIDINNDGSIETCDDCNAGTGGSIADMCGQLCHGSGGIGVCDGVGICYPGKGVYTSQAGCIAAGGTWGECETCNSNPSCSGDDDEGGLINVGGDQGRGYIKCGDWRLCNGNSPVRWANNQNIGGGSCVRVDTSDITSTVLDDADDESNSIMSIADTLSINLSFTYTAAVGAPAWKWLIGCWLNDSVYSYRCQQTPTSDSAYAWTPSKINTGSTGTGTFAFRPTCNSSYIKSWKAANSAEVYMGWCCQNSWQTGATGAAASFTVVECEDDDDAAIVSNYKDDGGCDSTGDCQSSYCSGNTAIPCPTDLDSTDLDSTACLNADESACCSHYGYNWNIGGEVSGTTCCGDDTNEHKLTRVCAECVCESSSSDTACCNAANKCVYNGMCYLDGYTGDIDGDNYAETCSDGTWNYTGGCAIDGCYYPDGTTNLENSCKRCGSEDWNNEKCGVGITETEICDGAGTSYEIKRDIEGVEVSKPQVRGQILNCNPPPTPPGYTRNLTGACNRRPDGVYKSGGDGALTYGSVCNLTGWGEYECGHPDTCQSITLRSWGSSDPVTYPSSEDPPKRYKVGDRMNITVRNVEVEPPGWSALVECKLNKTDVSGAINKGGIYFDYWVTTETPKTIVFNYTVKPDCSVCSGCNETSCVNDDKGNHLSCTQCDPPCPDGCDTSGVWRIAYCGVYSDFHDNEGWTLEKDPGSIEFNVTTGLSIG